MINKQLSKVTSFNISIQTLTMMMKFHELEETKHNKNLNSTNITTT